MRPLEQTRDILKSLAWQSRRIDPTGFFHMGARYYDPVAGAFISTDPLGHAECMDLYSYADGDPVNYSDPTGRGMQIHSASSTNPISVGGGNHNTLTSIAGTFQPEMPDLNPYPKSFGDRALDYSFAAFELMAIEAMYAVPHSILFMTGNWGEPAPGYQTWREFVWDTAEIDPNGWGGASLDAGTQLATLYLGYKLTGGGVQTAENAAFNVTRQADGWVTIAHPANADAFIQGRVVAGNLEVGMVNIPGPMQGQGLSKSLYQALANEARGVSSITGELANTNKMVFRDGLDAGLSVQQAAAATPAARARAAAGFTNHSYDPATGVLTSTR
jgi:RHS repeat-associated protein